MSRVDDERDAARLSERLAVAKQAEEQKKKDRVAADSAFARLVGNQKEQAKKTANDKLGRSTIAALLQKADADEHVVDGHEVERGELAEQEMKGFRARLGGSAADARKARGARAQGEQGFRAKAEGEAGQAEGFKGRAADGAASSKTTEGRKGDARVNKEVQAERGEASDGASATREGDGKGKGGLKTDADKGGGQQGGKDQKGSGSDVPAGFRFNPALAAPVPVAKKNEAGGNERLRRLATEIAQKIVERVRVGTNATGNAEFQIDLRNDVMGGMSVKVSAKNGKISAVFSGSDRAVLKQLEEQAESLKGALGSRGLTLESFKVEARA